MKESFFERKNNVGSLTWLLCAWQKLLTTSTPGDVHEQVSYT
jgi:hypothetical protein